MTPSATGASPELYKNVRRLTMAVQILAFISLSISKTAAASKRTPKTRSTEGQNDHEAGEKR
jgi:hypothetical protein